MHLNVLHFLILYFLFVGCSNSAVVEVIDQSPSSCAVDYELVWSDEFNGEKIDSNLWRTYLGSPAPYDRIPPRSSCNYSGTEVFLDENVWVKNGLLYIQTKKEKFTYKGLVEGECGQELHCGLNSCDSFKIDADYTSGSISSNRNFNYGYFETRAKITRGQGMYPVFWLWHHDELVVFEFFGDSQTHHLSIHRGEKASTGYFQLVEDYADDFHLYALEWTPFFVRWFFDGQLIRMDSKYFKADNNDAIHCENYNPIDEYRRNEFFIQDTSRWMGVNLSVNVHEGNKPDETTPFPTFMEVDYLRVFQSRQQ